MTEVGHFWFVPANIKTYSALVADMVPAHEARGKDGLRIGPRSKREFWDALASRDPRWLRRHGWPISIAGRAAGDFPGGTVAFHLASRSVLLSVDPAVSSPDYLRELAAHFGFECRSAKVSLSRRNLADQVGPPKPWY